MAPPQQSTVVWYCYRTATVEGSSVASVAADLYNVKRESYNWYSSMY